MKTLMIASLLSVALSCGAGVVITAPDGAPVCDVRLPDLAANAVIETTNLTDGVAWRIRYTGEGTQTIENEEWVFDFGSDLTCWPVSHAQGEYVPKTLSTIATMRPMPDNYRKEYAERGRNYSIIIANSAESPLVVEGASWTAVMGDVGVLDYARLRFLTGDKKGSVKTILEGPATVQLPYTTPWRYIHVAKNCSELAATQDAFLKALSPSSRVGDCAWAKRGKVLRVAKLTTAVGLEAVAFAARNGFSYIELDSGWYGDERTGDPLKPGLDPKKRANGEELDIFKIIAAAKEKKLGVILYVNREPLKKNATAIFDQLVAWGVDGVKMGFVNVGLQKWRRQVIEWIEMCAARRLVVDIHDEFRLAGIHHTYPHVLTVEGIHGNEEMPSASHNAALVYTRFLDGPGDYTPCWRIGRVKNTLAHQLATPCVYESGLQFLFWYSRPDQINEKEEALDFWREIPCTFDEVRYLQGKIGEYALVARRVDKKWFVGCLNANEKREFTLSLDFIGAPKETEFSVRLYRDEDPDNAKSLAPVACEKYGLKATDSLRVTAASNGGWAAIIEEKAK